MISLNKSILITGGTGSFGKAMVHYLTSKYKKIKRLVVFSRDELKQYEMSKIYNQDYIRYFLGDIRDYQRLKRAFENIDVIYHAAALKQVPVAEYNPDECIKTNIIGAQNIIGCALEQNIKKVVALSTDKAVAPINLYGATKLCSDKLFVSANNIRGDKKISFSVVRYGNVAGSRGSIIPLFKNIKDNKFPITHPDMTRFWITMKEAIELVLWAEKFAFGGEIFIPKLKSFKITDLALAIKPQAKLNIIGIRPGEKIHEELITGTESMLSFDLGKYYCVAPDQSFFKNKNIIKAKKIIGNLDYVSNNKKLLMNLSELRKKLLKLI
jgi:UDP-N-acetylglucosamine 4,6-dehydratase